MVNSFNFVWVRHGGPYADSSNIAEIYSHFLSVFNTLGIQPNYFGADDGKAGGEKYKKFNGAAHKKILSVAFKGYESCNLSFNTANSIEAYDEGHISLNFSSSELAQDTKISVEFDERLIDSEADFRSIIKLISNFWVWDYGFGVKADVRDSPGLFLLSGSNGRLPKEDERRLDVWYQAWQPELRRKKLRDIFPYMLVGQQHLNRKVSLFRTLESFILKQSNSSLERLNEKNWLWTVYDIKTEDIRRQLLGKDILLSE